MTCLRRAGAVIKSIGGLAILLKLFRLCGINLFFKKKNEAQQTEIRVEIEKFCMEQKIIDVESTYDKFAQDNLLIHSHLLKSAYSTQGSVV